MFDNGLSFRLFKVHCILRSRPVIPVRIEPFDIAQARPLNIPSFPRRRIVVRDKFGTLDKSQRLQGIYRS